MLAAVIALATLFAEPAVPSRASSTTSQVLEVRSASELGLAEATVQRALEGHFADLGYDVHVDFAPGERPWPPSTVQVELTRQDDGSLRVAMQRAGARQAWVRTLPPQDEAGLLLESLGVLIRSMLSAPLPEPEPKPEPTPEPEPTPALAPMGTQWALAMGYRGDSGGSKQRWHSGGGFDLDVRTRSGFAVGGGIVYTPPHASAGLQVQRVGGHLRAGARIRPDARLQPGIYVVAAAEGLGWSGAPPSSRAQPGWAPRLALGAEASLRVQIRDGWFVSARVGVLGWVLAATLDRSAGTDSTALFETDPAAGTMWVGVGYRWTTAPLS
ncbi:MAG: hypothetical protein ACRBN8_04680 [Nannocystales bacterium]